MLRRVATRVMTAVLVAGALQVAAPSAHAALAAPLVSPADGAAVAASDVVVTASYDDVVGSTMSYTRITVVETTPLRQFPCQDEEFFANGNTGLRCHVRDLVTGTYRATAVVRSTSGAVVRSDTWTFTVATPALTTAWPAPSQVLAGTADDPAPGPGAPITLTYDQALASGSSARLYATSNGLRTAVTATESVSGSTLSLEPSGALAPGEYVVTSDAEADPSGARTPGALSFVVGDPVTLPSAPRQAGTLDPGAPGAVTLLVDSGAAVGVVVYDPASPGVAVRAEAFPTVGCPYLVSGTTCVLATLPTAGLPPGDYHWYADERLGSVTQSTPDRTITIGTAAPGAATGVTATAPQSPADPAYVHVSGSVDAATNAVLITARRGLTTSRTVVTSAAGAFDAFVRATPLEDGDVTVTVVPYDGAGRPGPTSTVVTPKESVQLALTGDLPTIGPDDSVRVRFTEPVRTDVSVVLRTAQGAVVPGSQVHYVSPTQLVVFGPSAPLTSQTYQVDVTAYAASCPSDQTSTCEKLVTTVPQPVDATPPAAPTSVVVTPRALAPTQSTVRVTGVGDGDATVAVRIGTLDVSTTRGVESAGRSSFDTGDIDVSGLPRQALPVSVAGTDALGNTRVTPEGFLERRWPTKVTVAVSPLTIPWGTTTTVAGRLSDATTGSPRSAATVVLEELRDDSTIAQIGTARTDAQGGYAQPVVLTVSGRLRARFAGTTTIRPVASGWSSRTVVGARGATPADQPDTISVARTRSASPQGTLLSETLGSDADEDWYAFGVQTAGYHLIRLGHLAGNGTLALYDRAGHRLAGSDRSGSSFEELYRYLPAGTYFVRVGGSGSATPYHLRFWRVPDEVVILSRHDSSDHMTFTLELLNNTAQWRTAYLPVSCVSGNGAVREVSTWVGLPVLPPRSRRPYDLLMTSPCATGSTVRIGVGSDVTSVRPPAWSFSLSRRGVITERYDRRYLVDVTNHGTSTLRGMSVLVEEYDAEGTLTSFGAWTLDPLAAGSTRRVEVDVLRRTASVNLVRLLGAALG